MRKLLFFLCALLTGVSGARAEGAASAIEGLTYYIWNTADGYVSNEYKYAASKDDGAKFKLTVVTTDDDEELYYTIFNVTAQKYVNFTGTASGTTNVLINANEVTENSYWSITASAETNAYYITPKGGGNVSWNFFGGNEEGSVIGLWTSTQNGSWKFEAVIEDIDEQACTFKTSTRGAWAVSGNDATELSSTGTLNLKYDGSDTKQQFALVPFKNNYYLYSVAAEKFVLKDASLSDENADAITIISTGNFDYPCQFKFDDSHYINLGGGNQITIDTWGSGAWQGSAAAEMDEGNMIAVLPQGAYSLGDAKKKLQDMLLKPMVEALIAEANDILSKQGIPGYPNDEAMAGLQTEVTAATNPEDYDTAYDKLSAAIANAWANVSYIPKTDVYYTITNAVWGNDGSRGSMIYNPNVAEEDKDNGKDYIWSTSDVGYGGVIDYTEGEWKYQAVTLDDQDPNHLWGFIEAEDDNGETVYYMYNVGKQQFASIGTGAYPNGGTWIFSDTPSVITMNDGDNHEYTAPNIRFQATVPSTGETYNMSMSNRYIGPFITYYYPNDGGVPMLFEKSTYPVDTEVTEHIKNLIESVEPYRDALKDVIASTENIKFGDGLNQYIESENYKTVKANAEAKAKAEKPTKEELTTAKEELTAAIAALQLNMPKEKTFLRIKGGTSEKLLAAGNADNDNKTYSMSETEDATTVFYYDGLHLTNLGSGLSNGMSNSSWSWACGTENASDVTFGTGVNCGYTIYSTDAYFKDCGDEEAPAARRTTTVGGSSNNWSLAYVDVLPLTITEVGNATLWSPVALSIPEGVTAYTGVVNENKDYLNLTKLDGVIPAETAVVLQGVAGSCYDFKVTTGGTSVDDNALKGGLGMANPGNILTLQQPKGYALGFYTYDNENGLAGFKAYLPWASQGIKGIAFGTDTTDGIATVEGAATESSAIYNLAGQRVEKAVKGVYIVNGKKVLVK